MLDFTSSLYLGLVHASRTLEPWEQLTLGAPAVVEEPASVARTERDLAELVGCDRALLSRSTLHVFWDVFSGLEGRRVSLFWDDGAYPIAKWGIETMAARGVPARGFHHHSPESLARRILSLDPGRLPVVVCDGWCPGCGELAPLEAYLDLVRAHGGLLIVDDTQAVGVLGRRHRGLPLGVGGGGSLRWEGLQGPDLLWCGSLAKALGVPMAAVAGDARVVARIEARGETRVHCSPPSVADLHAAQRALAINHREGDALRRALAQRVAHFRERLRLAGLSALGGPFPVQRVLLPSGVDSRRVHERLRHKGVRTVLQRSRCGPEVSVSFILTTRHGAPELTQAVDLLTEALHDEHHERTRHERVA
ncbi:8-amino-7-oxononanoate synthase [Myxococcus stipitatus DSM 14675]|uniref:8-amino-7-oxononanoate synthase n=1 Tax=Myxococcus stipitatus (strain DSM 14675 / JCM 12634 / Mx s8) TaxID=1278073 RepID=L7U6F2_MYXSD|nr:aminotransferase class I/II-fold pyridoxal phosphate-dependent enzyme [Myxococcus stipitatus]AGC43182.1 8-amino-7-oxononanoate synthase [Myxococcus stipitatus DSM 14675]